MNEWVTYLAGGVSAAVFNFRFEEWVSEWVSRRKKVKSMTNARTVQPTNNSAHQLSNETNSVHSFIFSLQFANKLRLKGTNKCTKYSLLLSYYYTTHDTSHMFLFSPLHHLYHYINPRTLSLVPRPLLSCLRLSFKCSAFLFFSFLIT